ncbi:type VII secretion protein EccB [Streptomyces ochraceiscleroticus]|uniref:Type VII secretion protein EccB n=1 Tax=Streptomyces ochraceiscleroticus TaxID=47761 RepID=A0ABW1MER0_9ACTN|nr:type VII secretion protein EccB [Streptomyces ochraceiscleroticus]
MASRRDELNAYTFAKRRLVASFLQPSPSGTEEGAPRPLQAVVPGMIAAAVLVAGFGAWGMFKPTAPVGWDKPGDKVIIGSDSTTRYVVLKTKKHKQLHPVLNLASAKLLLTTDNFQVVNVDEKVLDSGKIPHGPTLGIPYAPDRLPSSDEAKKAKRWAVCEQQGEGGDVQKATFVFDDREASRVDGRQRLKRGDVMYVRGQGGKLYMVDHRGYKYELANNEKLLRPLMGTEGTDKPQRVSNDWLDTLKPGDPIDFQSVGPGVGNVPNIPGDTLPQEINKIGTVLKAPYNGSMQHYVVLKDRIAPITDFMAYLLLASPELGTLHQAAKPVQVGSQSFTPGAEFGGNLRWPETKTHRVNFPAGTYGGRDTVCSVLRGVDSQDADTTLSTWAGTNYPQKIVNDTTSAYVTPGSGLLFRQVQGSDTSTGSVFLATDSGLRYGVQTNGDSGTATSEIGTDGGKKSKEQAQQEAMKAQKRLGYGGIKPVPVPLTWSKFLPTGPRLDTNSARQPQGS